ncbi:DUF6292 family protein [Saccharothrix sp. HUAS TT1]|uniref:DUF6292 family protein n=1 Tax=unclassified Saccharothrix TaxID=2593673 RepID=UPI00345B9ED9
MDPDSGDTPTHGLRRYVRAVAVELGSAQRPPSTDAGPPATAYLALAGNLPSFPGRGFALVWDEEFGWAAAVRTDADEPPVVISYLGGDVLPTAAEVAAFVAALLRGGHPGDPRPIRLRAYGSADDFTDRLRACPP